MATTVIVPTKVQCQLDYREMIKPGDWFWFQDARNYDAILMRRGINGIDVFFADTNSEASAWEEFENREIRPAGDVEIRPSLPPDFGEE